jgi:hypothetical protein
MNLNIYEINWNEQIKNKKGVVILASPRSGSIWLCGVLFNLINNSKVLYEQLVEFRDLDKDLVIDNFTKIFNTDKIPIISITNFEAINFLRPHKNLFRDLFFIDLRRRDKIAQYASFCVMRIQWQCDNSHVPNWEYILPRLPFQTTEIDINYFITLQNLSYCWPGDITLYYEDLKSISKDSGKPKKYEYPVNYEQIFSDYSLVKKRLGSFIYCD